MSRKDKFLRRCISCFEFKEKKQMIRVMKEHSCGDIIVQPTNNRFGRSLYICKNIDCINNAFKKMKIFKILKIGKDNILEEKIRTVLE